MKISSRCDYACRACLEMALSWPNRESLTIHEISEEQEIPMQYLVHYLIQLKGMGLVESLRGKHGGYRLAKAPNRIGLGEVVREVGGPLLPVVSSATREESAFTMIWKEVEGAMAKVLDGVTFEDICNKEKGMKGTTVYQI